MFQARENEWNDVYGALEIAAPNFLLPNSSVNFKSIFSLARNLGRDLFSRERDLFLVFKLKYLDLQFKFIFKHL